MRGAPLSAWLASTVHVVEGDGLAYTRIQKVVYFTSQHNTVNAPCFMTLRLRSRKLDMCRTGTAVIPQSVGGRGVVMCAAAKRDCNG